MATDSKDPCWDNYKKVGMKMKGGKQVPNCVPASVRSSITARLKATAGSKRSPVLADNADDVVAQMEKFGFQNVDETTGQYLKFEYQAGGYFIILSLVRKGSKTSVLTSIDFDDEYNDLNDVNIIGVRSQTGDVSASIAKIQNDLNKVAKELDKAKTQYGKAYAYLSKWTGNAPKTPGDQGTAGGKPSPYPKGDLFKGKRPTNTFNIR